MENLQPEMIQEFDESQTEIRDFVGKNADYYLGKWNSAKDPDKRAGWNWSAFFAGIFWLGYRKQYTMVGLLVGIFLVIDIIQLFINVDLNKTVGTTIGFMLGFGGNSWYYKEMNKKIAKIRTKYTDPEVQKAEIIKAGGTSWGGVGIAVALFAVEILINIVLVNII